MKLAGAKGQDKLGYSEKSCIESNAQQKASTKVPNEPKLQRTQSEVEKYHQSSRYNFDQEANALQRTQQSDHLKSSKVWLMSD